MLLHSVKEYMKFNDSIDIKNDHELPLSCKIIGMQIIVWWSILLLLCVAYLAYIIFIDKSEEVYNMVSKGSYLDRATFIIMILLTALGLSIALTIRGIIYTYICKFFKMVYNHITGIKITKNTTMIKTINKYKTKDN